MANKFDKKDNFARRFNHYVILQANFSSISAFLQVFDLTPIMTIFKAICKYDISAIIAIFYHIGRYGPNIYCQEYGQCECLSKEQQKCISVINPVWTDPLEH